MTHIMVDLETWGKLPGYDIRSIGAVVFDPEAGTLGDEFYVNVEGGERWGLRSDLETVAWWVDQSDAAKEVLYRNRVTIAEGLPRFANWLAKQQVTHLWAHGPAFDIAILDVAYAEVTYSKSPWSHRAPRDTRTIYEIAGGVDIPFEGIPHYALDDAKHQARCVIQAYRQLRAVGVPV